MRSSLQRLQMRILPSLVWGVGILLIWEGLSWFLLHVTRTPLAQSRLPYLHKVLEVYGTYGTTLWREGTATVSNAAMGFLLGAACGVLLAIFMSLSFWVEQLAFPFAVASQMIPILGLAPILYGIVKDEQAARILIAGYITFFPVSLNMLRGLRSVPLSTLELMHSYAASPWNLYVKLRIPAALPALFSGLKIAAPMSVTGAILVELMGARHGIGVLMLRNLYYGPSHAYLFWATILTGAFLGLAGYAIIHWVERLVAPWQPEFRSSGGGGALRWWRAS